MHLWLRMGELAERRDNVRQGGQIVADSNVGLPNLTQPKPSSTRMKTTKKQCCLPIWVEISFQMRIEAILSITMMIIYKIDNSKDYTSQTVEQTSESRSAEKKLLRNWWRWLVFAQINCNWYAIALSNSIDDTPPSISGISSSTGWSWRSSWRWSR